MKEYEGWTLYKNLKIVVPDKCWYGYNYPEAYIVDSANKKQLQAAINWASKYNNTTYNVIDTNNEGFKLTILDSAKRSSHGGRLSFWDCLIEKESENIKVIVGIDSALLLNIIKNNKLVNGKCDSDLVFARRCGGLGMLSTNMEEYKLALRDMQTKKDISKNKTSKWQVGCNYSTLTLNSLYLGQIKKYSDGKFIKQHVCINASIVNEIKATKMSEIIGYWENNFKSELNRAIDRGENNKYVYAGAIVDTLPFFAKYNMGEKLPSRQKGNIQLEIDVDLDKEYSRVIRMMQGELLELHEKYRCNLEYCVDSLLVKTVNEDTDYMSEVELKLLSLINKKQKDLQTVF